MEPNAAIILPVANCSRKKWLEASVGRCSVTLRRTGVAREKVTGENTSLDGCVAQLIGQRPAFSKFDVA
jgi:hypothetical protein